LKKTRRGKFSEISGIFRISEIPNFGNFSEIFRKFRKFRKIPEIVAGKSSILEGVTTDYSLKPRKNPRIFPPKSPGNSRRFRKISGNFRKFRKIPEVIPGKSSILDGFTIDYSLKPRKNPRIFPLNFGEIPGNSENPGNSGNSRDLPDVPSMQSLILLQQVCTFPQKLWPHTFTSTSTRLVVSVRINLYLPKMHFYSPEIIIIIAYYIRYTCVIVHTRLCSDYISVFIGDAVTFPVPRHFQERYSIS